MSASEFAYDLKLKIGPYRIYWIAKRHRHLVKTDGWKRLWIEKHLGNSRYGVVYGMRGKR